MVPAIAPKLGAAVTISLLMPVRPEMNRGMDFPGFTSDSKRCSISTPSVIMMAISIMQFCDAWPPVVSISTIAYLMGVEI